MSVDVAELTHRKVAGIPLVYVGAGVAGLALLYAWRAKPTPDPAASDTSGADVAAGDQSQTETPVFLANPSQGTYGTGSVVTGATTQDTNDAWVRRGVEWLVSQGVSVSAASNALNAYVNGESLSYDQGKLRDRAVAQFGLPPETVPTGVTQAYKGPATRQGTPPVTHKVVGKSDDTFNELAFLYYGLSNADSKRLLASHNAGLVEPFAPGTAVSIPKWHNPRYVRATSAMNTLYEIARKNASTPGEIQSLNPSVKFPVKPGTRVRVA